MDTNGTTTLPAATEDVFELFDSHFTPRTTFYIVFQLVYMPIILLGATLTLISVYLVPSLHTAHDYILSAIAVLDLWITVVFSPFQVSKDFPGPAVLSDRWICAFHFNNASFNACTGLDLVTLVVINRFAMTYNPIWYVAQIHGKKRILITIPVSVVVVRVATQLVTFIYKGLVEDLGDHVWHADQCNLQQTVITDVLRIQSYIIWVEMLVCCVLNMYVVSTYCKNHGYWGIQGRRHRNLEAKWNAIQLTGLVIPSLVLWTPTVIYYSLVLSEIPPPGDMSAMMKVGWSDVARLCRLINAGLHAPVNAASKKVYRDSFRYLLKTSPCKWKLLPHWLHRESEDWGKVKDQHIKLERVIPAMMAMLKERSESSRQSSRSSSTPQSTSSSRFGIGSVVYSIIDSMVHFPDLLTNQTTIDDGDDDRPDRKLPSTSVSADMSVLVAPSSSLNKDLGTPSIFSPSFLDDEWRKERDTLSVLSTESPRSPSSNSKRSPRPSVGSTKSQSSSSSHEVVNQVKRSTSVDMGDNLMDYTMKWIRDSIHKQKQDDK